MSLTNMKSKFLFLALLVSMVMLMNLQAAWAARPDPVWGIHLDLHRVSRSLHQVSRSLSKLSKLFNGGCVGFNPITGCHGGRPPMEVQSDP
ncbi:hypothetical protein U1Q18_020519 [Sarracenia purpurea var. burkii]